MMNIDGFAYTNRLNQVHPAEKAIFALATMFIALGFSYLPVSGLVILLMSTVTVWYAGIPGRVYCRLMLMPLSFLVVGVLTIVVSFSTGTLDATAPDWLVTVNMAGITLGITYANLLLGAGIVGKSLAAVACLYFLTLTTPVVELASMMRKLKLPSLFIELVELVYRFIFVMQKTAGDIYTSQSSRWGYSSAGNSMKSLGQLTAALFVRAMYRSQALFTTLTSRGYTGELNVLGSEYTVSVNNIVSIVLIDLVLIIIALVGRGWI